VSAIVVDAGARTVRRGGREMHLSPATAHDSSAGVDDYRAHGPNLDL